MLRELVGVMRNLGPPANHPKCAEIIVQNIRIFTPLFPQIAIAIGVPRAGLASRGIAGSDVVQEPRKVNKQDENLANCPGNFETIGFMRGDRSSRRFFMTCANLTPKRPSRGVSPIPRRSACFAATAIMELLAESEVEIWDLLWTQGQGLLVALVIVGVMIAAIVLKGSHSSSEANANSTKSIPSDQKVALRSGQPCCCQMP